MLEIILVLIFIMMLAKGDYTMLWMIGGAFVIALLASMFGKKSGVSAPSERPRHRIDHPHYYDPDDYECSVCGARFSQESTFCPNCGVRFNGIETDETEFIEEEDEEEFWDEMDGL